MSPHFRAAALPLLALGLACALVSPEERQRAYAKSLKPKTFDGPGQTAAPGEPPPAPLPARTYRVRAYADDAYRSQTVHWEDRVRRQLARATEVTSRRFNVTFELVEAKAWSSSVPVSEPLASVMQKLEQLDPGKDVDLVLGYTSALPVVSASHDQLGLGRALGRHAILRGMESLEEDKALRASLDLLPEREREDVYLQRRAHKETAVLLHEWGHTLGAPHTPRGLMHDTYDPYESSFTDDSLAVMAIGLLQKPPGLDDPEVRAAWAKDMAAWLASAASKGLVESARKYLDALVAQGSAADLDDLMSDADRERMAHARKQGQAGLYQEAAELLAPLLERHPKARYLHALACQLQLNTGAKDDATWTLCSTAAELDPQDPGALLLVAELAQRRGDPADQAALVRARALLERQQGALGSQWAYLAELHRHRREVSLAESAVAHAPETERRAGEVRDWCHRTRRWVGLVPGAIAPDREGDYVAGFRQAQLELEQLKYGRVRDQIDALEKGFPGTVGALTLRCELQVRQGQGARGLKECRRALELYPESVHAQYLLGVVLAGSRAWPEATAALEKVVDLDPTIPDAWPRLHEAYRASGNARAADALRERFQQRFGKPPPFR